MEFQDRELTCQGCSQPFTFTAGEQEFYSRKGFQDEPKRCKPCREARKQRSGDRTGGGGSSNGHGNGFSSHGQNGHHDGGGYSGGDGRQDREMHDINCSRCGKPSQVPFRPTAGRPVFCRDCFSSQRSGSF